MKSWEQNLTIRTPEGVYFSYTLSSQLSRFMAVLIDWLCIIVISSLVSMCISLLGFILIDLASAVTLISSFVLSIGYPIICEWRFRGQTIGKRALRIRVIDANGLKLSLSQVIVRNLLRAVDSFPALYLLGGIVSFLSPRAQRLGDIAAATIVIQHTKAVEPDLQQLRSDKYNSLRDYPHLCAKLRQHTTPNEASIAADAIMRRDMFDDDARIKLFAELRTHFESKADFTEEVLFGLSDERFIRNVTDILFETAS